MTYLTVDDILSINYLVNARTGRRHGNAVNVINSNSLHYVVSAVSGKVFGRDLYKTIYDKAAAYAFNIMALRTILWIQAEFSAVKEHGRSVIRKISKASSWCFYMLNYAVDSFGECVSYPVFGIG